MRWIDATLPLSPATEPWPGDAPLTLESADLGFVHVTAARLSLHLGTHVDAPLHTQPGGATVDALDPADFVGEAVLADVSAFAGPVSPGLLAAALGGAVPARVLVRTRKGARGRRFPKEWRAVAPAVFPWLAARGVRVLGIDTPSSDGPESASLPSHRAAVASGITVIENLCLAEVPAGRCTLVAVPLAIAGAEASPVRALVGVEP